MPDFFEGLNIGKSNPENFDKMPKVIKMWPCWRNLPPCYTRIPSADSNGNVTGWSAKKMDDAQAKWELPLERQKLTIEDEIQTDIMTERHLMSRNHDQ